MSCYGYEGIDAVKSSLKAGLAQSTEEMPIKINLIAPPQYVMTTTTLDRTEGIAKLNTAIQVIRESIEESEGHFNIKMEVRSFANLSSLGECKNKKMIISLKTERFFIFWFL